MYVNYDAKALQAVEAADSQLVFEGMVKAIARFVQKIFDLNNKLVMHAEPARTKWSAFTCASSSFVLISPFLHS
jgi:hypothetical protein